MKLKSFIACIAVSATAVFVNAQEVYVLNSYSKLEPVTRAVTTGTKVSGKALLAAYGAKLTTSLVLDGKNAELYLPQRKNYFYIHTPKQIPIRSWKLVPLKKGKKNSRELPYAKAGAYSGVQSSLDEIELRSDKISDEIYCVWPGEELKKGDYALFRMESGAPAEIYDFCIDPSMSYSSVRQPSNEEVIAAFNLDKTVIPSTTMPSTDDDLMIGSRQYVSDVDINLPPANKKAKADNTVALVIANEKYFENNEGVKDVDFAQNDGEIFKRYLQAIGVPEHQIIHIENASLGKIRSGLKKLTDLTNLLKGNAKVIVYYAGHGTNDEANNEAYLLPVDASPAIAESHYKLSDFYNELESMNAKMAVVFIDACFSGAQRSSSGDMLLSARDVVRKVNLERPKGKSIVFAAASSDQTALPYKDKQHGMMTYFLLKKLQESNGNATLGELKEYILDKVPSTAQVLYSKLQLPTVKSSKGYDEDEWEKLTLR